MQEHPSIPPQSEESPSATGSWRPNPAPEPGDGASSDEADGSAIGDGSTVQRPSGSTIRGVGGARIGSGSRSDLAEGLVVAGGRGPLEVGLPANGDRLESFEVRQAIGVGGMGAVFRAWDVRLDRFVALKVLPPSQAAEAENVRRFYQEGRAAARLDHENIARVFTIGQDAGLHYIAFEFIDGTTIRHRVEQHGPLPVAEAINYTLQIAGALVHAADRGVIHRDIKPSNIIVTPSGRAKLVDMGLARRFERQGADDGLTQSNMTLGTFDYISPEQARDPRSVDVRSDLYSLGCTIYHMIVGQPPFPGGTVLQKLLSHREEPAPDVRASVPHVPSDLAAVVLKLMAKEPDRRYQTPEQLVRDLLTLAGALGLRSISPEGLVWLNADSNRPGWERHLYWGLPATVLASVVAALIWMGRTPDGIASPPLYDSFVSTVPERPPPAPATAGDVAAVPEPGVGDGASSTINIGTPEPDDPPEPPREYRVRTAEELLDAIRSAPAGSTVVLDNDGVYRLPARSARDEPIRADLTIRAMPGQRPSLRVDDAPGRPSGTSPMLHFDGGRVTLEGIVLDLGSNASGPAIRAEGTALSLSRCLVRGNGQPAALEFVGPSEGDAAMPVVLESCTMEGGRVGIQARGAVVVGLRDCTIAEAGSAVWFRNAEPPKAASPFGIGPAIGVEPSLVADSNRDVTSRLLLDRVSLVASSDPVIRAEGTALRVQVSDSLIAPPIGGIASGEGPATLLTIDSTDRLQWTGFHNLYGRIGTYLRSTSGAGNRPSLFLFEDWVAGTGINEALSRTTDLNVWAEADPAFALSSGMEPSRAFRPDASVIRASGRPDGNPVGALRGPYASISSEIRSKSPLSGAGEPSPSMAALTGFDEDPMAEGPMELANDPTAAVADSSPRDDAPTVRDGSGTRPTSEPVEGERPPIGRDEEPRTDRLPPSVLAGSFSRLLAEGGAVAPDDDVADALEEAPVRSTAELLDRLRALGPRGGVIRLAPEARIELPSRGLNGSGIVSILADPGPSRPLLRFLTTVERPSGDAWPAMLRLPLRAELHLRGVDLVLDPADHPAPPPRWAAFELGEGATLDLSECTVTIVGDGPSAVARLVASSRVAEPPRSDDPVVEAAKVRVTSSLIRVGGEVVEVLPGAQLDLEIADAVVFSGGSLVRGHGRGALGAVEEAGLSIDLRRVTAFSDGGLVLLDSDDGRPVLPVADFAARESILAAGLDGEPLFRVNGQGDLDALGDRIRIVDSRQVAYHRVEEYRRNQTAQPGPLPLKLYRDDWELAVGRREDDARHGPAGFLDEPNDGPPWTHTTEDAQVDPNGPSADLGPQLALIPNPPELAPALPESETDGVLKERLRRLFPNLFLNR